MAFPVVAATNTRTASAVSSINANLPASISAGDLLILLVVAQSGSNRTLTTPSGYTQIYDVDAGGGIEAFAAYYKVATGSEGATITVSASGTANWATISYRITGYSGTPEVGTVATGTGTTPDPPNLAPSWGALDTLWIAVAADRRAGSTATAPTNYSTSLIADQGASIKIAAATRDLNASSENPGTFTITSADWAANTIAIRRGAETTNQAVNVPSTGTRTSTRQTGKTAAFTSTGTRSSLKSVSHIQSAMSATGTMALEAGRAFLIAVSIAASGATSISLAAGRVVTLAITASGALSFLRDIAKAVSTTSTATLAFTKALPKSLEMVTAGTLSLSFGFLRYITSPTAALGLITRAITRISNVTTNRPLDDDITS